MGAKVTRQGGFYLFLFLTPPFVAFFGMKWILVVVCISLTLLLINEVVATTIQEHRRIVAMGDLHGDLHNTKKILRLAGLINDKEQWSGGDTIYVQTVRIISWRPFQEI